MFWTSWHSKNACYIFIILKLVEIHYNFFYNILYLENTNVDIVKSLIISFDYVNVNSMTYPLIKFWRLSKNLNTVPIEDNNVNLSCSFQCCCQRLHNNTYPLMHISLHNAMWMTQYVALCLWNVRQCVFRAQYWNDSLLPPTNELLPRRGIASRVVWYIWKTLCKVPYYNDMYYFSELL